MTRVLAVADEVEQGFYSDRSDLHPALVVACGDLPADYLEHVAASFEVPLLYVPGNHDARQAVTSAPGCVSVDGRIVDAAGVRVAGLGGSLRYRPGPNQYTQTEMRRRALALELRTRMRTARDGKGIDLLVTHAPPFGVGDEEDPPHQGFKSFHRLVATLTPEVLVHGHVHPYGVSKSDRHIGRTLVVNAVGHRMIEVAR
jgi:Icc-related predicted phosphoesterase